MIVPRLTRVSLLALAAVVATGCGTVSDNDVAARIGSEALSGDEVAELLAGTPSPLDPSGATEAVVGDRAQGDATRAAVSGWVRTQIISRSEIGERYAADPGELGVTCIDVALAADRLEAENIKSRLDSGEAWDDVVAPIEAEFQYESAQPCQPVSLYEVQLPPDLAATLAALKPGDAPEILDAGDGAFAVIRVLDLDELDSNTLINAVQGVDPDAVQQLIDSVAETDVYVDPRIGQFDPDSVAVVPVG